MTEYMSLFRSYKCSATLTKHILFLYALRSAEHIKTWISLWISRCFPAFEEDTCSENFPMQYRIWAAVEGHRRQVATTVAVMVTEVAASIMMLIGNCLLARNTYMFVGYEYSKGWWMQIERSISQTCVMPHGTGPENACD